MKAFNLPYLALPAKTPKEVALDVFIKMNTSSVHLSTYDIVVALVEEETGKSLHEHVDALNMAVPRAAEYADLPSLVLDVVALRQDRIPSQAGYRGIDYTRMLNEWDSVVKSIKGMVSFLEDESIFDAQRLPSYTAIPILAAMWEHLPTQPDKLGNARLLLRKYLWRAFLTSRYEQSSTSNALQDYRGLRKVLCDATAEDVVPILNQESYPLPSKEMVLQADWPKRKSILGRGLLSLQLKCGAEDLADGARATVATITSKEHPREYHHLFPAATLDDAGIPDEQVFRALNCALVTWKTNRSIGRKDPLAYLQDRVEWSDEQTVAQRLRTHLLDFETLSKATYSADGKPLEGEALVARLGQDFDAFLERRATLVVLAAQHLTAGRLLTLEQLMTAAQTAMEVAEPALAK